MATIYFGSARSDENYRASGGRLGDQRQTSSTWDGSGEVSLQPAYDHSKKWYLYRWKDPALANRAAAECVKGCNNPMFGYNQDCHQDLTYYVIEHNVKSLADIKVKCDTDCSDFVPAIVQVVAGVNLHKVADGNFYTGNAPEILAKSGLFTKIPIESVKTTELFDGDILTTRTKGHIVMVAKGNPRKEPAAPAPVKKEEAKKVTIDLYVLCEGMTGKEVKTAQILLNALGYSCGTADGVFGPKTAKAVAAAQADMIAKGLCKSVDKVIGKKTWTFLLGA